MKMFLYPVLSLVLLGAGCNRTPSVEVSGDPAASPAVAYTGEIPPGAVVHVRLLDTLDTKRNRAGDRFTATLDEPLVSGDRVVVPQGVPFNGHIVEARQSGRFKGRAVMALSLDSFDLNGVTYPLDATRAARTSAGHKKHNWLWIGGGSGGGAAIGAIAGGPAGALIGAGAGGAAGTAGAAITGKRNVTIPVETRLAFTLRTPVELRR